MSNCRNSWFLIPQYSVTVYRGHFFLPSTTKFPMKQLQYVLWTLPEKSLFSRISPCDWHPLVFSSIQAVGDWDGRSSRLSQRHTVAAAAVCPLHPPLPVPPVWDGRAHRECGGGVQRLRLPDGDQGATEPGELPGPAAGGEPHHCAGEQHQPAHPTDAHLRHAGC